MRIVTLVVAVSVTALVACGSDGARESDSTATSAADTIPGVEDANIVRFLDAVNLVDSTLGVIASTRGTHPDVRALGVMLKNDHHSLRVQAQNLATRIGATTPPPAIDSLPAKTRRIADSLETMPKGAAFDRAYLDHEIADHQAVLNDVDRAMGVARHAKLRELLTISRSNIEMHLARAKAIRETLGAGTMP